MGGYLLNVLIALDQLLCVLLGGFPDETMSSYAYRMRKQRKPWWFLANWIDWGAKTFFDQGDHCRRAYESERARAQEPPELRA